jgi:hypothetical protein
MVKDLPDQLHQDALFENPFDRSIVSILQNPFPIVFPFRKLPLVSSVLYKILKAAFAFEFTVFEISPVL